VGFALLSLAPQAKAALSFALTVDACTGTCGTGPFGQVLLQQLTSSSVQVTLTLAAGVRFADTGAGESLAYNLSGAAPDSITGITAGFQVGVPVNGGANGPFAYSVTCISPTFCQGGDAGNLSGPLTFTVNRASGITEASFIASAGNMFFGADIVGTNTKTGNVFAPGPGVVVPEPLTMSLVGAGLLMVGLRKARNRHVA
jgi:hypothetical protein